MKYLITSALIILSISSFAQITLFKHDGAITHVEGKAKFSSGKYSGSMGQSGTVYKDNGVTTITYCDNTRSDWAIKQNNKGDTTNYQVSIAKKDNVFTITHPDLTQSAIIDNGSSISVKASGGVIMTVDKLDNANQSLQADLSAEAGQYLISYNRNKTEVKTINGPSFRFGRKGNVAIITNWDGSYMVMVTTGKTSVIVDSKGIESLAFTQGGKTTVMASDIAGSNFEVTNDGTISKITRSNGITETVANYGGLSLLAEGDGKMIAMFNYSKTGTDKESYGTNLAAFNDTDGGAFTKMTFDPSK